MRGRIGDLMPLNGPAFTDSDEVWIADLRLEGTIEQGVLVGKDAIDGFRNDDRVMLSNERDLARMLRPLYTV